MKRGDSKLIRCLIGVWKEGYEEQEMPLLDRVSRAKNRVQDAFAPRKENWDREQPETVPQEQEQKGFARKALNVGGKAVMMGGKAVYKGGKAVGGAVADKAGDFQRRRAQAKAEAEANKTSGEVQRRASARGALSRVGETMSNGVSKVKTIITRSGDRGPSSPHGHGRDTTWDREPGSPTSLSSALVEFRNRSDQTVTVIMDDEVSQTISGGERACFHPSAGGSATFEVRDVIGCVVGQYKLNRVMTSSALEISENLSVRRVY